MLLSCCISVRHTDYTVYATVTHASYTGRLHRAVVSQEIAVTNARQKRAKAHDSHNLIAEDVVAAGMSPSTACLRLHY